jgi:hypothetical protein
MSGSWWTSPRAYQIQQEISLALGGVTWVVGLLTMAWFSIWMGLNSRKTSVAVLKTFCYAKILPWVAMIFVFAVCGFSSAFLASGNGVLGGVMIWLYPLIPTFLVLLVYLALIPLARSRVKTAFAAWRTA